ncbi:hypothetical protein ACJMK2_037619 [Sinanodonta woodiana]|uniref:Serine palmitoyltransferase small subunit B n=1 Tax=Sinanodonta woodiana TaxID=1069815 RepID=A0ABD3WL07_SINWO
MLQRLKNFLKYWYLQYTLITSIYMLEPLERSIFNTFLVAVLAIAVYSSYLFLPGHAVMMIHFIQSLFHGATEPPVIVT